MPVEARSVFYRAVPTPPVGVRIPAVGPARQERQFPAASGVRAGHERGWPLPDLPVPLPRRHPPARRVRRRPELARRRVLDVPPRGSRQQTRQAACRAGMRRRNVVQFYLYFALCFRMLQGYRNSSDITII